MKLNSLFVVVAFLGFAQTLIGQSTLTINNPSDESIFIATNSYYRIGEKRSAGGNASTLSYHEEPASGQVCSGWKEIRAKSSQVFSYDDKIEIVAKSESGWDIVSNMIANGHGNFNGVQFSTTRVAKGKFEYRFEIENRNPKLVKLQGFNSNGEALGPKDYPNDGSMFQALDKTGFEKMRSLVVTKGQPKINLGLRAITIENGSDEKVVFAYYYHDGSGGVVRGWIDSLPRSCTPLFVPIGGQLMIAAKDRNGYKKLQGEGSAWPFHPSKAFLVTFPQGGPFFSIDNSTQLKKLDAEVATAIGYDLTSSNRVFYPIERDWKVVFE